MNRGRRREEEGAETDCDRALESRPGWSGGAEERGCGQQREWRLERGRTTHHRGRLLRTESEKEKEANIAIQRREKSASDCVLCWLDGVSAHSFGLDTRVGERLG